MPRPAPAAATPAEPVALTAAAEPEPVPTLPATPAPAVADPVPGNGAIDPPAPGDLPGPTPQRVTRAEPSRPTTVRTRVPSDPGAHAAAFGRVTEQGEVYVRLPAGGEHLVGVWAAGEPAEGLAFFGVKYADILTDIELTLSRVRDGRGRPEDALRTAARHSEQPVQPTCVGDLSLLTDALAELTATAEEARARVAEERREQRATALAERSALVERGESLVESTAWRATAEEFRLLVEQWKAGTRVDRTTEQVLWQRLSRARSAFDRRRKAHFTTLARAQQEGLTARTALVERAEALAGSRDWQATTRAFREIVEQWKACPRASREDEQRLWQRLSAAQRTFFDARTAALAETAAAAQTSLAARVAIVERAEALLTGADLAAAARTLRTLNDELARCGPIPPRDRERLDRRMRAVEEGLRNASKREHQRTDPAKAERAQVTLRLLGGRLEQLRVALAAETDEAARARLLTDIASQEALVAAAEGALADFLRP